MDNDVLIVSYDKGYGDSRLQSLDILSVTFVSYQIAC